MTITITPRAQTKFYECSCIDVKVMTEPMKMLYPIMISIETMIQIHIQMQVYHTHDTDMGNVHRMFITHIYNIGIPKHEKHLRLLSSGTNLFYYLWVKRFFDIKREAQSFYAGFSICPHQHVWHPPQGLGEQAKVSLLLRTARLNCLFSNPPKSSTHASGAWRHSHPKVTFSIWDFYFDICEWHILLARASTSALMFAPN